MRRLALALAVSLAAAAPAWAVTEQEQRALDAARRAEAAQKKFMDSDMSNSKAPKDLRQQVARELFDKERAIRPTCEPEVVSIRETDAPKIGYWTERWFVKSCFERIPYRISYEPSAEAGKGTQFTITPDVGTHGYPVR